MTPEELREWYINDIESKQIVIDDLQAQLSDKEQELKTVLEEIVEERKIRECEFIKLKEQHKAKVDEVTQYARFFEEEQKRADTLRAENERLKKIIESDKETHERAEYSLRKRCEDLEAENEKFKDILQKCKAMMERDKVGGFTRTYEGGDYWEEGSTYEAVYFGLLNF